MAVDALASSSASNTRRAENGNRFSELSSEEFIRIITTELTRQDPLKPNDTNTLLTQLSSIRDIESQMNLTKSLDTLVGQNSFAAAGGMLGAAVTGVGTLPNGQTGRVTGLVVSIARTARGPELTLDNGSKVLFDKIDGVTIPLEEDPGDQPSPNPTPQLTPAQEAARQTVLTAVPTVTLAQPTTVLDIGQLGSAEPTSVGTRK
jgi:flagellar basal-body rod modification protein FlgD